MSKMAKLNPAAFVCVLPRVVHALHVVPVFACLRWRVGVRDCLGAGVGDYLGAGVRDRLGAGLGNACRLGQVSLSSVTLKCDLKCDKGGGGGGSRLDTHPPHNLQPC